MSNLHSTTEAAELLLAVDAGGTQTSAWLVELSPGGKTRIVGSGRSTGGNPLSVGLNEAQQAIQSTLVQARAAAQLEGAPIQRAILSIAGAAEAAVRDSLVHWAHQTWLARRVAVVSDFLPVLAAGTRDCVGVAIISGTGSSAFARSEDGCTARCGGWGYLLGDEGSGFAIGRAALQLALSGLEAGQEPRPLAKTVLHVLGVRTVSELTSSVYKRSDVRAGIAAMAPAVMKAAEGGDADAQLILESAASELAKIVSRAARIVGLTETMVAVAASGGVLVSSKSMCERLHVELQKSGLLCEIHVVDEPLAGCVRLAADEFASTLVEWF